MSDLAVTMNGDLIIRGTLAPSAMIMPASAVTSDSVRASANISADKLQHRHVLNYGQANSAATTITIPIFSALQIGQVMSVKAGSIAAAIGDSTVTVDCKKNGTSVLTGVITLDNANTARVMEAGTIDGAQDDLAAGDFLELVIVATVGTGTLPTGLLVTVEVYENGA